MATKAILTIALILSLNLLFFTLVISTITATTATTDTTATIVTTTLNYKKTTCPKDTLKLGACADVLNLVNVVVGTPSKTPCCSLIQGLTNLEAAVCLCTAIRANILGINLNVPISLSVLLNLCGKDVPYGFQCA